MTFQLCDISRKIVPYKLCCVEYLLVTNYHFFSCLTSSFQAYHLRVSFDFFPDLFRLFYDLLRWMVSLTPAIVLYLIVGILSTIFNIALLLCSFLRTPKTFLSYSLLLKIQAISDMATSLAILFTMQRLVIMIHISYLIDSQIDPVRMDISLCFLWPVHMDWHISLLWRFRYRHFNNSCIGESHHSEHNKIWVSNTSRY